MLLLKLGPTSKVDALHVHVSARTKYSATIAKDLKEKSSLSEEDPLNLQALQLDEVNYSAVQPKRFVPR